MMKKIFLAIIVLLLVIPIGYTHVANEVYVNDEYKIRFSYPSEWKIEPPDEWDLKHYLLYVKFRRPKVDEKEFKTGFVLSVKKYDDPTLSLMEYAQKIYEGQSKNLYSVKVKAPHEITLNGRLGIHYEISMTAPSLTPFYKWHIKALHYFFLKDDRVYHLGFTGEEKIYETEKERIENSINSFTIE